VQLAARSSGDRQNHENYEPAAPFFDQRGLDRVTLQQLDVSHVRFVGDVEEIAETGTVPSAVSTAMFPSIRQITGRGVPLLTAISTMYADSIAPAMSPAPGTRPRTGSRPIRILVPGTTNRRIRVREPKHARRRNSLSLVGMGCELMVTLRAIAPHWRGGGLAPILSSNKEIGDMPKEKTVPGSYPRLIHPLVRENGALRKATWERSVDGRPKVFAGISRRAAKLARNLQLLEGDERGEFPGGEAGPGCVRQQQHR